MTQYSNDHGKERKVGTNKTLDRTHRKGSVNRRIPSNFPLLYRDPVTDSRGVQTEGVHDTARRRVRLRSQGPRRGEKIRVSVPAKLSPRRFGFQISDPRSRSDGPFTVEE